MTEYLFVLGKNWLLSIAELLAYLERHVKRVKVVDHSRTIVIADITPELDEEDIIELQSALGGCFKTGSVLAKFERSLIDEAFPAKGKFSAEKRKKLLACPWLKAIWSSPQGQRIRFGISMYPMTVENKDIFDARQMTRILSESVKDHLLEQGAKKVGYLLYEEPDRRDPARPNTALWPQTIAKHNLLHPPNAEILVGVTDWKFYIAKTLAVYDSILQQYRDEARPFTSVEISTSPKVCRALLNFAGAKSGCTVLDPFCGTGTLLMEAALLGMNCIGIDINPEMVQGTKSNLKWLAHELGESINFKVIRGDARNLPKLIKESVDTIATEPYLGPTFTDVPTKSEAESVIEELTELYREFLIGAAKILADKGLVSMTIPLINTQEGPVRIETADMTKNTGLRTYRLIPKGVIRPVLKKQPDFALRPERERIPERKRRQIVQREIIVLGRG